MKSAILALSPHLDDAAFSCGGTLATLADANHRVIVATVFTRTVADPQGFALACQLDKGLGPDVDYMALRRDEDAAAMRILGTEPLWLDFAEAPHRGYGSAQALFLGLRPDDVIVGTLAPLLRALVDKIEPTLILAPRAVGGHVDHHAVRDAIRSLNGPTPVAFWTDHPYALKIGTMDSGAGVTVTPNATAVARRIAASCAYASQIGFQFGGAEALKQALEGHADEMFEVDEAAARRLSALLPGEVHA